MDAAPHNMVTPTTVCSARRVRVARGAGWDRRGTHTATYLDRDEPRLAAPERANVHAVDDGCPQELQTERPTREGQDGLVGVRGARLQNERHGRVQAERDALDHVQEPQQRDAPYVARLATGLAHLSLVRACFGRGGRGGAGGAVGLGFAAALHGRSGWWRSVL